MRTEVGLSHHTVGTIVDILEFEGSDDVIMVEFENQRGKYGLPNEKGKNIVVPIFKYEHYCKSINVIRANYGLNLSWARTVHANQGVTCSKVVYIHGKTVHNKDLM